MTLRGIVMVCVLLFMCSNVMAQAGQSLVVLADQAYEAKREDEARKLYEQAAAEGNRDAHFALGYKYALSRQERIAHFAAAAKAGHSEALDQVLEELFYRSNSLSLTNPKLAYEIYEQAKRANPELGKNRDAGIDLLKKCMEVEALDVKTFVARYKVTENDTDEFYGIWEMAADASRGIRFGKPDPKLVLQLVIRGGNVPAEKWDAVRDAYDNWKKHVVKPFEICDYVTSGYGLGYCSRIAAKEQEKGYQIAIKRLEQQLKNGAGPLLKPAYSAAAEYVYRKAFYEEGHGGTGYVAWAMTSIDKQKTAFLDLVKRVNNGYQPKADLQKNYDKELNDVYKRIIEGLGLKPIDYGGTIIDEEGVRSVQRLWIAYRDAAASLFGRVAPTVGVEGWKQFLTKARIAELKAIDKKRD